MPTLLPTVKGWTDGTDWILSSLTYDYNSNVQPLRYIGGPSDLVETHITEDVRIVMVANGLHECCPILPDHTTISNGYYGSSLLVLGDRTLEYKPESTDFITASGRPHIMVAPNGGITEFVIKGTLVI